jgi:hypothetical protein
MFERMSVDFASLSLAMVAFAFAWRLGAALFAAAALGGLEADAFFKVAAGAFFA